MAPLTLYSEELLNHFLNIFSTKSQYSDVSISPYLHASHKKASIQAESLHVPAFDNTLNSLKNYTNDANILFSQATKVT